MRRDECRVVADTLASLDVAHLQYSRLGKRDLPDRTGELVPLASVVRLTEAAGATELSRFNRLRSVEISANLAEGSKVGNFCEVKKADIGKGAEIQFIARLEQIIGHGRAHCRQAEKKGKLGRRAFFDPQKQGANDGRARAGHARDHRHALTQANDQRGAQRQGERR